MAKPIVAVSGNTRNNSVLELVHIFKQILEYVTDDRSNCQARSNCLRALETLIELGYKAAEERGIYLQAYQKHLQSYIYHSSTYFGGQAQTPRLALDDHASKIAQSLVDMLLLAISSFEQLGCSSYRQDFAHAVETLLECVGGSAGLSPDAAALVLKPLHINKKNLPSELQT
jgi:hypothetical protein